MSLDPRAQGCHCPSFGFPTASTPSPVLPSPQSPPGTPQGQEVMCQGTCAMDLSAKAPQGVVAGGWCHPGPRPHHGSEVSWGGKGGCRVERSSSVSARPVPNLHQPETMTMTGVGIKMKNVSVILTSWRHPAQGTEGREAPGRPSLPRRVPRQRKESLMRPRCAAVVGAARLSAARGNNREDDRAGTRWQGRVVSDSPAFMSASTTAPRWQGWRGVGRAPRPHARDPCPNPAPGVTGERERLSLVMLRHRLRGSWQRVSQPWFPGAEREQDRDVLARPALAPAIQGWQRLVTFSGSSPFLPGILSSFFFI